MPEPQKQYDCAIIGGGIAGLSLAILLAKAGKDIVLFEKENFPFHKVCGEYISNESVPFLESLGIHFDYWKAHSISSLLMTSPSGIAIKRPLDVGGVGLSRYELDNALYEQAKTAGVTFHLKTKVNNITTSGNDFHIYTTDNVFRAKVVAGAYGKHANIDVQLGRNYKARKESDLFIAVKHHIQTTFDTAVVEMHNFDGGYCGMSAIENGKVNMSYICKASRLKQYGSISNMEQQLLSQNKFLKNHFEQATFIFPKPLTISHLYFNVKERVTDNILMIGDAAGNIAPLSGNGMSIGLRSAKLAFEAICQYLNGTISFASMAEQYQSAYYKTFAKRIRDARQINAFFGHPFLTNTGFRVLKTFPFLVDFMGGRIHGPTF
jgi:flavin-dependent dehydrogenase